MIAPPNEPASGISPDLAASAGKYLTFSLGSELYGIPALGVGEIVRQLPITPVPGMPAFLRGVINLRGRIVPVMDLRIRFGCPPDQEPATACIVVVHVRSGAAGTSSIGLVVDAVNDVSTFYADHLRAAADFDLYGHRADNVAARDGAIEPVALLSIESLATSEDPFRPHVLAFALSPRVAASDRAPADPEVP